MLNRCERMAAAACASCGATTQPDAPPIALPACGHVVCRECVRERCAAAAGGEPFACARCACGSDMPLEAAERALDAGEFATYSARLGLGAACEGCAKAVAAAENAAPCGHAYCGECVRRMSRLALRDRALVPVRCCRTELPLERVRAALGGEAFAAYLQLLGERDWQRSDLASDAEYARAVALVGAKHCPGCGVGVQRAFGCVHMTCPAGHEFCFSCLRPWRSCDCPLLPNDEVRQILGEQ